MPSADDVIELMLERADDDGLYGDDNGDWRSGVTGDERRAASAELDTLLKGWLDRHRGLFQQPWVLAEQRNTEELQVPRVPLKELEKQLATAQAKVDAAADISARIDAELGLNHVKRLIENEQRLLAADAEAAS